MLRSVQLVSAALGISYPKAVYWFSMSYPIITFIVSFLEVETLLAIFLYMQAIITASELIYTILISQLVTPPIKPRHLNVTHQLTLFVLQSLLTYFLTREREKEHLNSWMIVLNFIITLITCRWIPRTVFSLSRLIERALEGITGEYIVSFIRRVRPGMGLILFEAGALLATLQSATDPVSCLPGIQAGSGVTNTFLANTLRSVQQRWAGSEEAADFPEASAAVEMALQSIEEDMRSPVWDPSDVTEVFRPLREAIMEHIQMGGLDADFFGSSEASSIRVWGEIYGLRESFGHVLLALFSFLWYNLTRKLQNRNLITKTGVVDHPFSHLWPVSSPRASETGDSMDSMEIDDFNIDGISLKKDLMLDHPTSRSSSRRTSAESMHASTPLLNNTERFVASYLKLFFQQSNEQSQTDLRGQTRREPTESAIRQISAIIPPVDVVTHSPFPESFRLKRTVATLTGELPDGGDSHRNGHRNVDTDFVQLYVRAMAGRGPQLLAIDPYQLTRACGWPIVVALDGACRAMDLYGPGFEQAAVLKWAGLIESLYRPNFYHNPTHVADVITTLTSLLARPALEHPERRRRLRALVLAAAGHDAAHGGVNGAILVAAKHPISLLYRANSPLERYHAAIVDATLRRVCEEVGDALRLEEEDFVLISTFIEHTDPAYSVQVRSQLESPPSSPEDLEMLGLTAVLDLSDIANQTKPWALATKWAMVCCQEFAIAAKLEEELGLKGVITSGETLQVQIPHAQCGFLQFVIRPLLECMNDAQSTVGNGIWDRDVFLALVWNARANYTRWSHQDSHGAMMHSFILSDSAPAPMTFSSESDVHGMDEDVLFTGLGVVQSVSDTDDSDEQSY
eukprot:gnl/Dysnectes_brevis/3963_a5168_600.p1 GENE.gnl/Dysnectes_brevis/3963_a5168_600~~gnl/Dysnectes_brevis/3963_a5168_600.p1  ORF type:complete len:980 (-),score=281.03 gnl/Dysnectes_brevis/3963_a5168_600:57-2618(-)